mmetsp:Transcript_72431/g.127693  ORF Transcript_72431/g.127693 Transcript_72431/m.127693 type:complete len:251 (-) Transcript_72431:323-1075(-)
MQDERFPTEPIYMMLWKDVSGYNASSIPVDKLDDLLHAVPSQYGIIVEDGELTSYKSEHCSDSITINDFKAAVKYFVLRIGGDPDFEALFDRFAAQYETIELSQEQFIQSLLTLGDNVGDVGTARARKTFEDADVDRSGAINKATFVAYCKKRKAFVHRVGCGIDFGAVYDRFAAKHKVQMLSGDQFIQALYLLGDLVQEGDLAQKALEDADPSRTGSINKTRFVEYCERKHLYSNADSDLFAEFCAQEN